MPNHVINEVILHGTKLKDVQKHLLDHEGRLSFAVLLPLPLNYWSGSVGQKHEKAFPGTHLNAATTMWGTKWDAYGGTTIQETESGVVIQFQSAWNHPRGWVCALFNTVQCAITASWLSEGGAAAQIEHYKWDCPTMLGQPTWDFETLNDGCAEHRRLHKLLWGVEEFTDVDEE
ncbi:hypothetical protein KQ944_08015 [Bacillus subtilis]|uniref:hypothetical protein n=1 Tax=Pseudochrobactrum asaccharolyticum TaxID=354351 RepID=UPI001F349C98|nr:hypothetical protein [Pseudochrobactrum asaccharolyticum]MCF7645004.1 hypothetical protein [Pseudochrobactrum asaccharolyticum]MCF7671569.1 hypothetical protein [Bacillus subtilis]